MGTLTFEARVRLGRKGGSNPAYRLGFWSATIVAVACAAFSAATVLLWFGVLSPPWDVIAILVPSLVLASSFVVLMVSVHDSAPEDRKIWSRLAVAFAEIYAPLVSLVYVVQLSVVEPLVMQGQAAQMAIFSATHPGGILWAIDGLGYVFMSLSTLFAAPIFGPDRLGLWIRWLLVASGVVGIPILMTYFVNPAYIFVAAPWSVAITGSAILLALHFRRQNVLAAFA